MNSKKSPVLITGGNGYIGSILTQYLLERGYSVRVLDKFLYGRDILKDLNKHKNLELIEGDVSNLYTLISALKGTQSVIHLAGIVGDAACSIDPKLSHHVNVVSTRMLRDSMRALNIPKLIFASSCSVYGITKSVSNEESVLNPVSIYAQTKIDAELDLLSFQTPDFHPTILRFATVFGHSRKPRFDLVANLFTAKAYSQHPLIVSNGKQWRPFIHVYDLARAITLVLEASQEKVSREIFNVGDEKNHMRINELAEMIKVIIQKDKPVTIVTQKEMSDKRDYRVSFKKIRDTLGFTATVNLTQGIEEMYECFKKGIYKQNYFDPFYSNLEMTKVYLEEFNTLNYKKEHVTEIQ
jgi:nucleoside-diphosphate-sugar epimerase